MKSGTRTRSALVVTAALLLSSAAFTAPAAAAPVEATGTNQSIKTKGGKAIWYHRGDRLRAVDTAADGKSVVAEATAWYGFRAAHAVGKGNSKTVTHNRREGTPIKIRLCYRKGAAYLKCSDWQKARA